MSPNTLYLIIAIAVCAYAVATTVGLICLNRRQNKAHQELSEQKKALQDLKDSLDGSAVEDIIRYRDEAKRYTKEVADILEAAKVLKEKLEDLVRRAQRRLAELEDSRIIRLLDRANELLEHADQALQRLDRTVESNVRKIDELKSDVDDLRREDNRSDWKDREHDDLLSKHQKEIAELQSKGGSSPNSGAGEGSSGAQKG